MSINRHGTSAPPLLDGSTLVNDSWELFELSNDELFQHKTTLIALIEQSTTHHTATASCVDKWREWLAIVDGEMGERGVAYGIGKRLMSLGGEVPSSSVPPPASPCSVGDDRTVEEQPQGTECPISRVGQFDALMCIRPPWFADVVDASLTPCSGGVPTSSSIDQPRRKGLWDDDDDETLHRADDEDTGKHVRRTGRRRVGTSRVATMNKMGYFVVPERRRKKAPAAASPPPKPSKKPPLPSIPSNRLRTSEVGDATRPAAVAAKGKPISPTAHGNAGHTPLPKRSATAVPFGSPRTTCANGASTGAPRPSSAEPLSIAADAKEQTDSHDDVPLVAVHTGATRLEESCNHPATSDPSSTSVREEAATEERTVVEEGAAPAATGACTRSIDPTPWLTDGGSVLKAPVAVTVPGSISVPDAQDGATAVAAPLKCSAVEPKDAPGESIEATERTPSTAAVFPSPMQLQSVGCVPMQRLGTPGEPPQHAAGAADEVHPPVPVHVAPERQGLYASESTKIDEDPPPLSAPTRRQSDLAVEATPKPLSPNEVPTSTTSIRCIAVVPPPPPVFPSLESLMVDPTYFFTFDTQPMEVRKEGMRLLRRALCRWMGMQEAPPQRTSVVDRKRQTVRRSDGGAKRGTPLAPLKKLPLRAASTAALVTPPTVLAEDDDDGIRSCLTSGAGCWYLCQTSHAEVYDLVTEVLEAMHDEEAPAAWRETPQAPHFSAKSVGRMGSECGNASDAVPACWNLWWTWGKPRVHQAAVWLHSLQFVNHIPKSWQLTKKDCLKANVQRFCRRGTGGGTNDTFLIVPPTFVLPKEYVAFASAFAELRGTWIMKTVGMSRGRGISLVSDISDVVYDAPVVVQRYIDRPLTIDGGFKFDLRLYVLVTSFQPRLEAFVSTLGFARIASYAYSATDLSNKYAHLTNTSVSHEAKSNGGGARGRQAVPVGRVRADTKWTLERLGRHIDDTQHRTGQGPTWSTLWQRVKECVVKSLVCVEDVVPHAPCTFELFGYDVLIDASFTPWILEVNASPSLEVDCAEDEAVKPQMIEDTVALLDVPVIQRTALLQAIERRLADPHSDDKKQWAQEWHAICGGWQPRTIGVDPPMHLGSYEVLAPSPRCAALQKAKRIV